MTFAKVHIGNSEVKLFGQISNNINGIKLELLTIQKTQSFLSSIQLDVLYLMGPSLHLGLGFLSS